MLDKFTTLTIRILKVLGIEQGLLTTFKSSTKDDGIYRCTNELDLYTSARLYISDFQQTSSSKDEIEIYESISCPETKLYINIISNIFYNHINFPINITTSYINKSAEYIVDDLLGYSDEEFKLYISLL